ncbi:MAG TPA: hypothetical protein DCE76_10985 [Anaerolineaceae bacterium]|nr:hypothetical protein [Anaerolineaceae bacterium]
MNGKVLVFSIHEPFRALLLNSLKGSGYQQASIIGEVEEARQMLAQTHYETLVVDLDAGEEIQQAWLQVVQEVQPARLIIFPPDNDRLHPLVGLLRPDTVLIKPFYLPDLLAALQESENQLPAFQPPVQPHSDPSADPRQTISHWLEEGNALGVVILREGRPPLLIGSLEEEDLREAGLVLGRFWQSERRTDLIRYFRPHQADRDMLLYATLLSEGTPLGLLFEARTSLREARRVSQWFAKRWNELPPADLTAEQPPSDEFDALAAPEEPFSPFEEVPFEEGEILGEFEQIRLDDILENIPPPDPVRADNPPLAQDWQPESEFLPKAGIQFETQPESVNPEQANRVESTFAESLAALEETRPSRKTHSPPVGDDFNHEARQSYTCILLPRSPQATLEGKIGEELLRWLPDFCATLGYTLESLSVEPRYLMWTVNLPPAVSPGHLVRIVRDQSSGHLAECIPELAGKGNFWASAHLILRSRHAPEASLIEDFIIRTRRRQGFLSS